MSRRLGRLTDFVYRRRGRVIAVWIVAAVVIIGLGSPFGGAFEADYATPGSESKAARDLTEREFAGFTGEELFVVWRDPAGATSKQTRESVDAFLAKARKIDYVGDATPVRASDDGTIATTTLPLTASQNEFEAEDGEQLIAAAERHSCEGLEIKVGGEPVDLAQEGASPEAIGFLAVAVVLRLRSDRSWPPVCRWPTPWSDWGFRRVG